MAHTSTTNNDARIISQCARGRRIRNIATASAILAADRAAIDTDSHILANIIDGETSCTIPLFVAPCDATVVRCFVNAKAYPTTSGAATVTFSKAVIGGSDVALNTAIDIDNPTAETAIDGVLSTTAGALSLVEGQLVYATVALSATTAVRSDSLVLCVEWIPNDIVNAS
jgi:hypothetical protein